MRWENLKLLCVCYQKHSIFVPLNLLFRQSWCDSEIVFWVPSHRGRKQLPNIFKMQFERNLEMIAQICLWFKSCRDNNSHIFKTRISCLNLFPQNHLKQVKISSKNVSLIWNSYHEHRINFGRKLNLNFKFLILKKDSREQSLSFATKKNNKPF
jgi:hypothetical protein